MAAGCVHDLVIEIDDDLQLNGWHLPAEGRSCEDREQCDRALAAGGWLVLYFPGNAGHRRFRVNDCQDLTELGTDVFLFDYRGYADNPGRPSETALAADAQRVWKYATKERAVPPERIVLFGESLGGGVATRLASEVCAAGTPPAGLIVTSTFSSLADTGAWHYPWLPVRTILVDRYPSVARMPAVTCPVLQIHGARDDIVPIELGRKLFAAIPEQSAQGMPKQWVELPTGGHNDIPKSEFRAAVGRFFAQLRNGASTAP